jgi:acetyl-CoA carboxylase biotin carboxyl carrier protein
MFKFEEICELVKLIGTTKVASVEIEHAGERLRIEGVPPTPVVVEGAVPSSMPAPASVPEPGATGEGEGGDGDEELHWITSPIVGTFYRAPNPDAEPYVKVGDGVEAGQTLCIVEAMKLMNEIESDLSGTVVKVLPANAQPVEYGERLFGLRPA